MVDHTRAPKLESYVEKLVEVRRKKNVTPDMARDLLADPNYFGTVRTPHKIPHWLLAGTTCVFTARHA